MKIYWSLSDIPELKSLRKEEQWHVVHEATYTTRIFFSHLAIHTALMLVTAWTTEYIGNVIPFLVFVVLLFVLVQFEINWVRPRIARVTADRKEIITGK